MSDHKDHTVVAAELAKDLVLGSDAKNPAEMSNAFTLFYATILNAAKMEPQDHQTEIERLSKEFRAS